MVNHSLTILGLGLSPYTCDSKGAAGAVVENRPHHFQSTPDMEGMMALKTLASLPVIALCLTAHAFTAQAENVCLIPGRLS